MFRDKRVEKAIVSKQSVLAIGNQQRAGLICARRSVRCLLRWYGTKRSLARMMRSSAKKVM